MIKKLNKTKKKTIFAILLSVIILTNILPISQAARLSGEINIFSDGANNNLLKYNEEKLFIVMDMYRNEGKKYPAYNAKFPTNIYNNPKEEELISEDSFVWQVVANGYPYKDISELDCMSLEEAYSATQAAIYCAYCGHIESDYSYYDDNEASIRTYNAFLNILENARKNTISIDKNNIVKLINKSVDWQVDSENENYVSKYYVGKTNYDIDTYKVEISDFDDAIITDENNNRKTTFNKDEVFKVSLPISSLDKSGELKINITTEVEEMPIYLGVSPYNKYIMTAPRYEKETKTFTQNYQENLTSINVTVREADTKIGIENSLINLLDENKELISTLTTNRDGKIFIEHLLPGTYYIEQISTEEGYITYQKLTELNMDYNKVANLSINNSPEDIQNIYNKEENVTITEEIKETNINNEYSEVNINNKTEIKNETNVNNSYTENNIDITNNQNNTNNNTHITNENNENNIYTENNNKVEQNVNNENTQHTVNNNETVTNENNINNIYTENNNNQEHNVKNENTVENNIPAKEIALVKTLPKTGM